jgi:hypothetical protein
VTRLTGRVAKGSAATYRRDASTEATLASSPFSRIVISNSTVAASMREGMGEVEGLRAIVGVD